MRRNTNNALINDASNKSTLKLDEVDVKIIALLVSGEDNKQIAKELGIPLSTIQRRTRKLFEKQMVVSRIVPNYKQIGYSKGVIHLYINNIDAVAVSKKLAEIPGVISVSIHIGNSDIVGEIIYKNSMEVLDIIAECKRLNGVTKVVWSEEVYSLPSVLSSNKVLAYFKRE